MTDWGYGDDTGLCYWCMEEATTEYNGLPLCNKHANEKLTKDMQS